MPYTGHSVFALVSLSLLLHNLLFCFYLTNAQTLNENMFVDVLLLVLLFASLSFFCCDDDDDSMCCAVLHILMVFTCWVKPFLQFCSGVNPFWHDIMQLEWLKRGRRATTTNGMRRNKKLAMKHKTSEYFQLNIFFSLYFKCIVFSLHRTYQRTEQSNERIHQSDKISRCSADILYIYTFQCIDDTHCSVLFTVGVYVHRTRYTRLTRSLSLLPSQSTFVSLSTAFAVVVVVVVTHFFFLYSSSTAHEFYRCSSIK